MGQVEEMLQWKSIKFVPWLGICAANVCVTPWAYPLGVTQWLMMSFYLRCQTAQPFGTNERHPPRGGKRETSCLTNKLRIDLDPLLKLPTLPPCLFCCKRLCDTLGLPPRCHAVADDEFFISGAKRHSPSAQTNDIHHAGGKRETSCLVR